MLEISASCAGLHLHISYWYRREKQLMRLLMEVLPPLLGKSKIALGKDPYPNPSAKWMTKALEQQRGSAPRLQFVTLP